MPHVSRILQLLLHVKVIHNILIHMIPSSWPDPFVPRAIVIHIILLLQFGGMLSHFRSIERLLGVVAGVLESEHGTLGVIVVFLSEFGSVNRSSSCVVGVVVLGIFSRTACT